ncbi:hypothetical protein JZ751_000091 [Albula glossodonta]|uniref:Secreted protein n=1 Tax=Albula glossodonta TaxID=121402 RepID=A0A8T2PV89_9TELE|nr:hypothetical protein JZ751_000091 [Albula glossodonta]
MRTAKETNTSVFGRLLLLLLLLLADDLIPQALLGGPGAGDIAAGDARVRAGPGGVGHLTAQPADGLAHGAWVVGQALDVLEGLVDDAVGAGVTVLMPAGQSL